ncbi:MAG: Nif3-like dinuclear metal center hexameric protein [Mycoplasmataceae bacterium]|jgi:dinuclear metal center YbgI/SA1388 family protein|nr:Nif3-like dinuclear metal center hexameric protein [Mycoplasmataceae bacterium]
MTIKEIHTIITAKFPLKLQDKWDESGINFVADKNARVTGVLACLDLTEEVLTHALKNNCNLIISHHPVFLKNKDFKPSTAQLTLLKKLKQNNIGFISYHTNVDNARNGINSFVAHEMGLGDIKIIQKMAIGKLKFPYRPKVLASTLKGKFRLERILFTSEAPVKSIAVVSGAGFSVFQKNLNLLKNIDLLITGDMKHHDWLFAKMHNMNVMDVGHELENAFIDLIQETLGEAIIVRAFPNHFDMIVS